MSIRRFTWFALVGLLVFGIAGFTAPAAQDAPGKPAEGELSDTIDRGIAAVWKRDGIKPTGLSTDEEFLRRVYLDTTGLPPTAAEAREFLDSKSEDKRAKLIARLVDDRRFAEHMGDLWSVILLGRGGDGARGGGNALLAVWLADRVHGGASFRDIIYELVTATGSVSENPAVAIYTRERPFSIANAAGLVSKSLTGVQIQCAECHDHPYEEAWKESTFRGMASFFSPIQQRLNQRSLPPDPGITDDTRAIRLPAENPNLPPQAQARIAEARKYAVPVTIDGKAPLSQNRDFWRPYLAKWMISPENRQTARYVANRFWSFAFGSGLHNPVDDFNSINTPSHPELLEALTDDFIASGYDIKRLYRAILNSRTYQLSGRGKHTKAETWHFAAAPVRQLTPEQFFGALMTVSGGEYARAVRGRVASPIAQLRRQIEQRRRQQEQEQPNMREVEFDEAALTRLEGWYNKMSDGWLARRMLAANFSRQTSDDEMTDSDAFTMSMDQALAVMNGEITNGVAGRGRGAAAEIVRAHRTDVARIEALYLTVLSRRPTTAEQARVREYLKATPNAVSAYEDLMFALIAGAEFATNH